MYTSFLNHTSISEYAVNSTASTPFSTQFCRGWVTQPLQRALVPITERLRSNRTERISQKSVLLTFILLCFFAGGSAWAAGKEVNSNQLTVTSEEEALLLETRNWKLVTDATYITKIVYYIDGLLVSETTTQLKPISNRASVRVGAKLSPYAIQQSIKLLYATQQYSQIQVYAQETSDSVILTYQFTSFESIKAIELMGIPEAFGRAIKDAMKSKIGGKYVPAIAKSDIKRIKRICEDYGYFDPQITVSDVLTEDGTLVYQIDVGAPSIIRELQIQGNRAISIGRLKAACDFSSQRSPIYSKSDVDTDVAALLKLYSESNYPTAGIESNFIHETGVLQFRIDEGKEVRFNFVGDLSLSQQDTFKEDIAKLINAANQAMWEGRIKSYFEDLGYQDTTVEVLNETSIQLRINPGTQYRVASVTFSGNRVFSDAELLREMTVKPTTGIRRNLQVSNILAKLLQRQTQKPFFDPQDLDTDEHRLRILYEKAGYPNRDIQTNVEKQPLNRQSIGEAVIHISINEDRKEVIQRCNITGNRSIDTATLLKRLESELPFPQPNARFEKTVYQNAVLNVYRERGYIDAEVNGTYISQAETPIFRVAGNFSEPLTDGQLPSAIQNEFEKHNRPLTGLFIANNIGNRWSIQDTASNPRYTLIQAETDLQVIEHGILHLTVEKEGEQVAFGKFSFQGDTDIVKQHVLEREVAHLKGSLWTPEALSRALRNLYSLGIFRKVVAVPLETDVNGALTDNPHPTPKTKDVVITVEKQKPRTHSESLGYSFAEGWRGTLELTHSNFLFKRNIRGSVRGRLGWRDELGYLLEAKLTQPWLVWRIRSSLQASAKKLEVDDNVRALEASFILNRRLAEANHLDFRYSYRDLNQSVLPPMPDVSPEIGVFEEQNPFATTVSSLRLSWTYNNLVRPLNPIGGMLNEITLEYAGGFLQGETSFIKTTTDTRYYQRLVRDFVLATVLRLGVTTGLRSNRRAELISFERFWAGGGTTVRGYAERSLGPEDITGTYRGDVQFIFNTELRFPIYWLLRGALFFDAGNVWNSLEDLRTITQLPSAVGAGLYLDFGPLTVGVDYAVPLVHVPSSPDTRRAHFRLGSIF